MLIYNSPLQTQTFMYRQVRNTGLTTRLPSPNFNTSIFSTARRDFPGRLHPAAMRPVAKLLWTVLLLSSLYATGLKATSVLGNLLADYLY